MSFPSPNPAVGSTLHLWILLIDNIVATCCWNPFALSWPWGRLHWAGKAARKVKCVLFNAFNAFKLGHFTNIKYCKWIEWALVPVMFSIMILTRGRCSQFHGRSTCHTLCRMFDQAGTEPLCTCRYLWAKKTQSISLNTIVCLTSNWTFRFDCLFILLLLVSY